MSEQTPGQYSAYCCFMFASIYFSLRDLLIAVALFCAAAALATRMYNNRLDTLLSWFEFMECGVAAGAAAGAFVGLLSRKATELAVICACLAFLAVNAYFVAIFVDAVQKSLR